MAETSIFRVSAVRPADRAAGASSGRRPWRVRLWAMLNAQSLIRGTGAGPNDVAFIEDDRSRLTGRER